MAEDVVEVIAARIESVVGSARTVYRYGVPDGTLPSAYLLVTASVGETSSTNLAGLADRRTPSVDVKSVSRDPDRQKAAREALWGARKVVDALTDAAGHENAWEGPYDIALDHLQPGDNVLAAEVHQSGGSSSDMVFGAELKATYYKSALNPVIEPPVLNQPTRQGGKIVITWNGGTLESSDSVTGGWQPVANATSPFQVDATDAGKFYRVRQ